MASSSADPVTPQIAWRRPLLAACWALLLGTVLWPMGWAWPLGAACLLSLAAAVRRQPAWLWLLAPLALGVGRAAWADHAWQTQPLLALGGRTVVLSAVAIEPPVERPGGSQRLTLRVRARRGLGGGWQALGGRVQLRSRESLTVRLGDQVEAELELQAPRTAGNPGQYSDRAYLQRRGIALLAKPVGEPRVVGHGGAGLLRQSSAWLRSRLCGSVARAMPGPAAAATADVLNCLVFGLYAAPIAEPIEEAFRRTGLAHLLVASGSQVSLLIGLVLALCAAAGAAPRTTLVAGVGLTLSYLMVTGPEASVVRAALMGLLVLWAAVAGRDYDVWTAVGLSAALQVMWWPAVIGDVGFQLSYLATVAVLLLGLPLARAWSPPLSPWLAAVLGFSLAAQLLVGPLLVLRFRQLATVGLVSNIPALPLAGLLVPAGLLAAVVGLAWPAAATALLWPVRWLLDILVAVVGSLSRWSAAYWHTTIATPMMLSVWVLGLALLCLAVAGERPGETLRQRLGRRLAALGRPSVVWPAACLLAVAVVAYGWQAVHPRLSLSVFDVGEGDAMLVRGPGGRTLLVDGGPRRQLETGVWDAGERIVVPALMLLGVRRLDDVVATHGHADHIGGLAAVIDAYGAARVWLTERTLTAGGPELDRLLLAAHRKGAAVLTLTAGTRLSLGDGAEAVTLWPPAHLASPEVNDDSAVLRVRYGQTAFLLAADLQAAGEQALASSGQDLAANLLKVAHQGSATSSTEELLNAVRPQEAIISVGPNEYGHPSPETLARLRQHGVRVARTDEDGMVTCVSNGRRVWVETYGRR